MQLDEKLVVVQFLQGDFQGTGVQDELLSLFLDDVR